MYYSFLIKSLILFFSNIVFFLIVSKFFNSKKIKYSRLNLMIFIFFGLPIILSLIGLFLSLIQIEVLFSYLIINLTFMIIYPGLDYDNIPSLKILMIIKNYEKIHKKPCSKNLINTKLNPKKIILKRINELKKDKFLKKNSKQLKLNFLGELFVLFFSLIRSVYNIKDGKG